MHAQALLPAFLPTRCLRCAALRRVLCCAPQEWMWACADAGERLERHTVLPSLRMMGLAGRPFTARDVAVFRLDSLEGDAIGQVIVFSDWQLEESQ